MSELETLASGLSTQAWLCPLAVWGSLSFHLDSPDLICGPLRHSKSGRQHSYSPILIFGGPRLIPGPPSPPHIATKVFLCGLQAGCIFPRLETPPPSFQSTVNAARRVPSFCLSLRHPASHQGQRVTIVSLTRTSCSKLSSLPKSHPTEDFTDLPDDGPGSGPVQRTPFKDPPHFPEHLGRTDQQTHVQEGPAPTTQEKKNWFQLPD